MKFLKGFFEMLLDFYKICISPFLGSNCRFTPSCSEYAKECVDCLPIHRALIKICWRILRCGPWSQGGDDPVKR